MLKWISSIAIRKTQIVSENKRNVSIRTPTTIRITQNENGRKTIIGNVSVIKWKYLCSSMSEYLLRQQEDKQALKHELTTYVFTLAYGYVP